MVEFCEIFGRRGFLINKGRLVCGLYGLSWLSCVFRIYL